MGELMTETRLKYAIMSTLPEYPGWEGSTSKSISLMVAVAVHPRTATSET